MRAFHLTDVIAACERSQQRWHEFLRVSSLSMGIYHLKVGDADEQKPHNEDEVYLVLSGKASFLVGSEVQAVAAGSLIFVDKCIEHRFLDIAEDLTVLVFFAPLKVRARELLASRPGCGIRYRTLQQFPTRFSGVSLLAIEVGQKRMKFLPMSGSSIAIVSRRTFFHS